jgi:ribose transport system ATP-binding protein
VRTQADAGTSVVYVSHRFAEIAEICDRATVLRDGLTVASVPIVSGVEEQIIEMMLGGRIGAASVARAPGTVAKGTPRLAVKGLGAGRKLADVSFEARRGEVLGIVALEGQGQDELFEVLAGFRRPDRGGFEIDGVVAAFGHPADAIAAGHTYVPGNRADALAMQQSVRDNIALPFSARIGSWGPVNLKREAARVAEAIARLQIDTRAQGEVRRLSGGNQQKVTIGRWLATGVETLLLFDPTRGIDVRTKRQIYPLVRELAENGALVLFYTSELDEVRLACDRAVVIFNGRVVEEIAAADATDAALMRAAYGLVQA